mgnify:CR=1 FL=1
MAGGWSAHSWRKGPPATSKAPHAARGVAKDADDVLRVCPSEGTEGLNEVHGEVLGDASGLVLTAPGDEGGPSAASGVNHPPIESGNQLGRI